MTAQPTTKRHDDDVYADRADDDEYRYLGGKASATTTPGEPPTMSTVTERDTATDAGSQLADVYHVVMFSTTAAAMPLRAATITRRLIDAIRVVGASLHRPPARRHYPRRQSYLERARMAREMHRL
jgi:hypothetical protein